MDTLSVVIATKNEEQNIKRCLESVRWADEIVIVDDISSDKTVEICKEYTDKIFINDSHSSFHKNKNLGIEMAMGNWVFCLDADEIITPELRDEILTVITSQPSSIIGYYVSRKNYFLGKWIRGCGWYPDYTIRLFKKGATSWPLEIHGVPKIEGKNKVGYLGGCLTHYSYRSLSQYFEKFNRYTSIVCEEEYRRGIRLNKISFLKLLFLKPVYFFLRKYFFQKGFKDGLRGFFISFSSALGIFVIYTKVWEKQNNTSGENL